MERSADWMAQARSDLDHARHDLEAEFYEQRHIDHAERILTFCDDLMAGPDAWRFVASIRAALPALGDELPVRRIVLFGSHASGRATVASDAARRLLLPFGQGVDLLVVYEGPSREDAFATVKKTVPVRGLEPHVYTADEASSRQKLLARMTRDGIVICDEEEPRCWNGKYHDGRPPSQSRRPHSPPWSAMLRSDTERREGPQGSVGKVQSSNVVDTGT